MNKYYFLIKNDCDELNLSKRPKAYNVTNKCSTSNKIFAFNI